MEIDRKQVVDFMLKYGPHTMKTFWDKNRVVELVEWYWYHVQLAVIYQQNGEIAGVGFARIINRRKRQHKEDPWRVSKDGNCIYIQSIAARHPKVVCYLWQQMIKIFGVRKYVAGMRHYKLKVWKFADYDRKISILNRN